MKNHWKITLSVAVAAGYLLIGLATSDDEYYPAYYGFSVANPSDSCGARLIGLVYPFNRNLEDTLLLGWEIQPRDTFTDYIDSLDYRRLIYTCLCPSDSTVSREVDVVLNAGELDMVTVGCE